MKRMKTYQDGQNPPTVDVYEEEIPGEGHMIAFGGPNVITVPGELGGGIVEIVKTVYLDACPRCNAANVKCVVTTRKGPSGRAMGVVCCPAEKMYLWVELPESEGA